MHRERKPQVEAPDVEIRRGVQGQTSVGHVERDVGVWVALPVLGSVSAYSDWKVARERGTQLEEWVGLSLGAK